MSHSRDATMPPEGRLPLREMPPDARHHWLLTTRDRLQAHMQWERAYLTRRAQRGRRTRPTITDIRGQEGLAVEQDLLTLLHELLAELEQQRPTEGETHAF